MQKTPKEIIRESQDKAMGIVGIILSMIGIALFFLALLYVGYLLTNLMGLDSRGYYI
jgi:hypothetical protein